MNRYFAKFSTTGATSYYRDMIIRTTSLYKAKVFAKKEMYSGDSTVILGQLHDTGDFEPLCAKYGRKAWFSI